MNAYERKRTMLRLDPCYDGAKRWGVGIGTSEAGSVTGGRVEGRLAR